MCFVSFKQITLDKQPKDLAYLECLWSLRGGKCAEGDTFELYPQLRVHFLIYCRNPKRQASRTLRGWKGSPTTTRQQRHSTCGPLCFLHQSSNNHTDRKRWAGWRVKAFLCSVSPISLLNWAQPPGLQDSCWGDSQSQRACRDTSQGSPTQGKSSVVCLGSSTHLCAKLREVGGTPKDLPAWKGRGGR